MREGITFGMKDKTGAADVAETHKVHAEALVLGPAPYLRV
jgi:hypothetical protein